MGLRDCRSPTTMGRGYTGARAASHPRADPVHDPVIDVPGGPLEQTIVLRKRLAIAQNDVNLL